MQCFTHTEKHWSVPSDTHLHQCRRRTSVARLRRQRPRASAGVVGLEAAQRASAPRRWAFRHRDHEPRSGGSRRGQWRSALRSCAPGCDLRGLRVCPLRRSRERHLRTARAGPFGDLRRGVPRARGDAPVLAGARGRGRSSGHHRGARAGGQSGQSGHRFASLHRVCAPQSPKLLHGPNRALAMMSIPICGACGIAKPSTALRM